LEILAAAVNGNLASQKFIITYTDNSTTTITQSVSDWFTPQGYPGESVALSTAYRDVYKGTTDNRTFDLYGYSFGINANKTVKSLTLPAPKSADNVVVVLAVALASNCGGKDYCAVKLTQSALQ
jgi:nickel-dependent lactate racemase